MRAVVEFYGEHCESYPAIRIILVKGDEDLTIKIEDQGGGVPNSMVDRLFTYSYSTAETPAVRAAGTMAPDMNSAPLAGFGYGLPMSRLYARYFGGDLKLVSTEGYGMDSLVYLKVLAIDAKETLTELEELNDFESLDHEQLVQRCWSISRENETLRSRLEKIATIVQTS